MFSEMETRDRRPANRSPAGHLPPRELRDGRPSGERQNRPTRTTRMCLLHFYQVCFVLHGKIKFLAEAGKSRHACGPCKVCLGLPGTRRVGHGVKKSFLQASVPAASSAVRAGPRGPGWGPETLAPRGTRPGRGLARPALGVARAATPTCHRGSGRGRGGRRGGLHPLLSASAPFFLRPSGGPRRPRDSRPLGPLLSALCVPSAPSAAGEAALPGTVSAGTPRGPSTDLRGELAVCVPQSGQATAPTDVPGTAAVSVSTALGRRESVHTEPCHDPGGGQPCAALGAHTQARGSSVWAPPAASGAPGGGSSEAGSSGEAGAVPAQTGAGSLHSRCCLAEGTSVPSSASSQTPRGRAPGRSGRCPTSFEPQLTREASLQL